ncbi:aspartate aminotransferase family protein [Chitinophaga alhagiae]|uniref:Aspartate aminotransferase family protein n=1 Tax=Chitinophaga alhagiae TaxID=2203219 RepID=A0ABN5LLQ8_9BACT|nr:aspartate aminotransferase family protein [Chitinophaga alhagiae]AWO00331.1 aspartate aminotransferase family protein [Chitinophaga alhagiae]
MNQYKKSAELLERAKKVLAGGVSSEFRKYSYPHALFYTSGEGCRIYDADGNGYLDFSLSQGPLILGHSHPEVLEAVHTYTNKGQLFAGQHIQELELAEKIQQLLPGAERMRFCLDGSAAIQTAFRLARAKTGKQLFIRFEGHYHGWMDNVSWALSAPGVEALGSRLAPEVFPWSQGLPEQARNEFITLPWNDLELLRKVVEERAHEIAAVITEPVMCNAGCILPEKGFLEGIRELCTMHNITFILDEVITGFRLSLSGAQGYFGVVPDLAVYAKAIASGYPLSVICGKYGWMQLLEKGTVVQAGTMNAANATVAAALATVRTLEKLQPYKRMFDLGQQLMDGLREAAKETGHRLLVQGPGPMFHTGFTRLEKVRDFRDTFTFDKEKLNRFVAGLQNSGIRVIGRGLWYISAVHTADDIRTAIEKSRKVLDGMNRA